MGLDAVELVIEVEEAFQIKIDDRDAEKILTVGQLHDYIVERLPDSSPWRITAAGEVVPTQPCLTAAAFYRLRRGFIKAGCKPVERIRPSTPLAIVLPPWHRRKLWKLARGSLGLQFPQLHFSKATRVSFAFLSAGIASLGVWLLAKKLDGNLVGMIAVFCFIATYLLLKVTLQPLAIYIAHARTFGDLARWVVVRDYDAIRDAVGIKTPQSVWGKLVAIVSDQLDVDPVLVTPEASFVKDLGVD